MSRADLPHGAEQLYTATQVGAAYDRLARELDAAIDAPEILLLAVMTGGMFPAVEIAQRLERPMRIDYAHATRYRGRTTGGEIEWRRWPALPDERQSIVVVDDIFDEGYTLDAICDRLGAQHDVTTAVLARKLHDRGLPRDRVDHFGLDVPDRYVFGCGMDYHERLRELPDIWALPDGEG